MRLLCPATLIVFVFVNRISEVVVYGGVLLTWTWAVEDRRTCERLQFFSRLRPNGTRLTHNCSSKLCHSPHIHLKCIRHSNAFLWNTGYINFLSESEALNSSGKKCLTRALKLNHSMSEKHSSVQEHDKVRIAIRSTWYFLRCRYKEYKNGYWNKMKEEKFCREKVSVRKGGDHWRK